MELLALFVLLGATSEVTYDAEVLPSNARPPWSFRETENCSVTNEDCVLHGRDEGTAHAFDVPEGEDLVFVVLSHGFQLG